MSQRIIPNLVAAFAPSRNKPATAQFLVALVFIGLYAWSTALGVVVGLLLLLPIVIAIQLGISRRRTGWMWGFFLGWLGVLILACMRPQP